jgi:hypothetical protein
MDAAAVTVAVLALVFTVGSFYWLYGWPGRVRIGGQPSGYGFARTPHVLLLRLPLAFYNASARPRVVLDLRARMELQGTEAVLPWRTTRKTLRPQTDDVIDFATPFAIGGRSAVPVIAEFGLSDPTVDVPDETYRICIDAREAHHDAWREVGEIRLGIAIPPENRAIYIAHTNRAV